MHKTVLIWRWIDRDGLERLELETGPNGMSATSTVICLEADGFRLDHQWQLDHNWCAQSVTLERWCAHGHSTLHLERMDRGWEVNGLSRPDLEGVAEPDLSVTPFCNTFPIRRMLETGVDSLTLDTALIDGQKLTVKRSRQRYDRRGPGRLLYSDLGISCGFEAELLVDEAGLVLRYEHLFERVGDDSAREGQ